MGQTQTNPIRLKDKIFKVVDIILASITLLVVGYIAGVNLLLFFIGYNYDLISNLLLIIVIPKLFIVDLVYLIIRLFRSKLMNITFIIAILLLTGLPFIWQIGLDLFYLTHEKKLDHFAGEILQDQSIYEMSDCLRYSKRVNRYYHNTDMEEELGDYYSYFVNSLKNDGIPEEMFERNLQSLRELKLIKYTIENNYIIFAYDGFIDNEFGFLYLIEGEPPVEGDGLDWGQLVSLIKLSDHWYYYAMT